MPAAYDANEAIELLTQAAARMPGNEFHPARTKAAEDLLEALSGLDGKAGFKVGANTNPNEGGFFVQLKAGDGSLKRAWVGADSGVIFIRPLGAFGPKGDLIRVEGLRLNAEQTYLEGAA